MSRTTKINTRSSKWYGWLPDLPDHRDFFYSPIAPKLVTLPRKVDMRSKCSPVEDQRQLGSCTANALVGALEFLELKHGAAICRFKSFVRVLQRTRDRRHSRSGQRRFHSRWH